MRTFPSVSEVQVQPCNIQTALYMGNQSGGYSRRRCVNHSYSCRVAHSLSAVGLLGSREHSFVLGGSGGVVNSLDFCPASLKSLGCF